MISTIRIPSRTFHPAPQFQASRPLSSFVAPGSSPGVTLIREREYTNRILQLIDGAEKSIDIADFIFTIDQPGEAAQRILAHLLQKKRDNPEMQIRVFLEENFFTDGGRTSPNAAVIQQLRDAGIEVKTDTGRIITHNKAVLIDGKTMLAGSHNLENVDLETNFEASLELQTPGIVRGFQSYYDALRADSDHMQPMVFEDGGVKMATDTAFLPELIKFIDSANTSLDISNYAFGRLTMPTDAQKDPASVLEIVDALERAKNRGVKVRVFLNQSEPGRGNNYPFAVANLAMAKTLHKRGIDTVHFDDPTKTSHAKFAVRDGEEVMVGSHNWGGYNLDHAHDLDLFVKDRGLAQQVVEIFDRKYNEESFEPLPIPDAYKNLPDASDPWAEALRG